MITNSQPDKYLGLPVAVGPGDPQAARTYLTQRYPDHALERLLREYSIPAYLPGS